MKVEEVPQDNGMIGDYGHEVCYAVGADGRYTLAPSLGWEAKNIVNDQAWALIVEETAKVHRLVRQGELSPIAYHQARHQMDVGLGLRCCHPHSFRLTVAHPSGCTGPSQWTGGRMFRHHG